MLQGLLQAMPKRKVVTSKGPERQFTRLDCWQARVNGGLHDDAQNCQNDNDTHSGC